jgi:hypothetical protein
MNYRISLRLRRLITWSTTVSGVLYSTSMEGNRLFETKQDNLSEMTRIKSAGDDFEEWPTSSWVHLDSGKLGRSYRLFIKASKN